MLAKLLVMISQNLVSIIFSAKAIIFENAFAKSVTTPATARPPAIAAALTGSTPANAPTPTDGKAKDMNSASERVIMFFVTCSVICFSLVVTIN